jgi:hypothetical protein
MHSFHALDCKYMNNGRKWNLQTLGGNYFKEITWSHTHTMHTDVHLIINRMLRLYTTDDCRFCKTRFARYIQRIAKTHLKT